MKKRVLGKSLDKLVKENTREKIKGFDFLLTKDQLKPRLNLKSK